MSDEYWGQQNAIFQADIERQERLRDLILKPCYYERVHADNYEFIKHGDPRAVGGVDTIASGKTYDEKIVQWPRHPDGSPRDEPYTAFALETMSCTIVGRERHGWMKTNAVNFLFYCFTSKDKRSLDCYLINFMRLQQWFFAQDHEQWYRWRSQQANETECRIVPIEQVCSAVPHERLQFSRPFGDDCYCGAPGLYVMFEGFVETGRQIWFCDKHRPSFWELDPYRSMFDERSASQ
jgi:hypothetical protein